MRYIETIEETKEEQFKQQCEALIDLGYEMKACSCGFVNSAEYDFCTVWMAIFEKKETK